MSYEYPVTIDQEILGQYREELEYINQEVEMLAINLERNPEDMATVEQIRHLIQESWMSSVKLELVPISESLADTLKGLDLLLDWQVYPPSMTEFILGLIDRLKDIASEVEARQFIDMRKTQSILVALQYIILAKDMIEINRGIGDAVFAISQPIPEEASTPATDSDVMLFDDGVDLFGDDSGTDLFDEPGVMSEPDNKPAVSPDIFTPDASLNPLLQARDYIQGHSDDNCRILLEQMAGETIEHHAEHTRFLLELALSMNILSGNELDFESIYKGICMHDLALACMPALVGKKENLSQEELDELRQHPVKSAELAREFILSEGMEQLVLHHHERLDGSGYPFGLSGSHISEYGRLAAIVDSFHDVINKNRQESERDKVLKGIMEINLGMGEKFDPAWGKLFNTCIRDYWLPDWREQRQKSLKKTG